MKRGLILLLLSYCTITFGQNFNRPVPDGIFPYEFAAYNDTLPEGYYFATPLKLFVPPSDPNFVSPAPTIYDKDGYIFWYTKQSIGNATDFKYLPVGNQYVFTYFKQGVQYALTMDDQFNVLDTIVPFGYRDVHEFIQVDNGNYIIATRYNDTMDLSAYTFDGTQGSTITNVRGFGYEEIDASGNLIAEWNSNDFLHPTETLDFWGYNVNDFDYCHGNAIEEDTDGNFLMSHRHLDAIHKVDRQTGNIIWRLGGELSDFTFTNDSGFSGQHDVRRLPNGDISIFDNGNSIGVTRGVTYSLDTVNWTATKTNEFIHPTNATSNAMGSYTVLTGGEQVLGFGRSTAPNSASTIASSSNDLLAEFFFADSVVSYRFLHFNMTPPERPEIVCNYDGASGNYSLEVLGSHNEILWSTGETNTSINIDISQEETYQVWVNQGIGMLGSHPFIVEAGVPPSACFVGLDEISLPEGPYTLIDVLGKEVTFPQKNTLYLKVYQNGLTEKIIFE